MHHQFSYTTQDVRLPTRLPFLTSIMLTGYIIPTGTNTGYPDYMRLDLSATLNGNLKAKKLNHSSFTFTVYNVLGRRNPYSIFFQNDNGLIKGYQMSIFGQPIFMMTYNFKLFGNASNDL